MIKKTGQSIHSTRRLINAEPVVSLGLLLATLVASIVVTPLILDDKNIISTLFACLIIISLILALRTLIRGSPNVRLCIEFVGIVAVVLRVAVGTIYAYPWMTFFTLTVGLLFNACMMVLLIKYLFVAVPQIEKLLAAINFYLLTGISFSQCYLFISLANPHAFNLVGQAINGWPDYLYFSFVTLTTLGYGDILPLSSLAQSLVSLEAIIGVLSPTIMIARFVGK
ncbi:MAG: potassium channel family protein [Endozoicomonas sp. (ex Botrylloides leachii)]|nr:potassium channel family protein [Endozoicomonas sp. (ex Botrylloides leachii)]